MRRLAGVVVALFSRGVRCLPVVAGKGRVQRVRRPPHGAVEGRVLAAVPVRALVDNVVSNVSVVVGPESDDVVDSFDRCVSFHMRKRE